MNEIVVKLVETEEEMEAAMGVRFQVFVANPLVRQHSLDRISDAYDNIDIGRGRSGRAYLPATPIQLLGLDPWPWCDTEAYAPGYFRPL